MLKDLTVFLMILLMKQGHRQANGLFKHEDLRLMHYVVTAYIANYKGISQKNLSEIFLMDRSDISNIVKDLEKAKYVTRQSNISDRRRLSLEITPAGKLWLRKRNVRANIFEGQFMAPLSAEERSTLRTLLTKMLR